MKPITAIAAGITGIATWLLLIAAGFVVVSAGSGWALGGRLLSVQSASMAPTFRPGDALVLQRAAIDSLHPGDIVSYYSPHNSKVILSHRLVQIDPKNGWLTTRGDASPTSDPAFPPRQLVGKAIAIAPKLGTLLDALHQPLGLSLTIYLPAGWIIGREVRRLTLSFGAPQYRLFARD